MKKFNFSLQKVLEIKEQLLENLKIELSALNNDLKTLELEVENLKTQYKSVTSEFSEKSSIAVSVGEMAYFKLILSSILKKIDNNEEKKKIVQKKLELKRQEIIDMNMEISSFEKLREKELEKYNKSVTRSEELFIEEFVSNKNMSSGYAI